LVAQAVKFWLNIFGGAIGRSLVCGLAAMLMAWQVENVTKNPWVIAGTCFLTGMGVSALLISARRRNDR